MLDRLWTGPTGVEIPPSPEILVADSNPSSPDNNLLSVRIIEEHLAHGIARVVERPAEGQFHVSFPKPVGDGARIRDGPGQPVEFRHDQRAACAYGGEGRVEAGSVRVAPVRP